MQGVAETKKKIDECQRLLLKSRHKVPIPKVLQCYGIMIKLFENILNNPKDDTKRVLNTTNKIISEKVWSMPNAEELFIALGYAKSEPGKLKFAGEDFAVLKAILEEIKEYKDKYDQIPEESLKYTAKAEEEEKKRKMEMERLEKQAELDRKDKSKDFVPTEVTGKELKFGATEVVFKPPAPARK